MPCVCRSASLERAIWPTPHASEWTVRIWLIGHGNQIVVESHAKFGDFPQNFVVWMDAGAGMMRKHVFSSD
jgi:hypothetical protein